MDGVRWEGVGLLVVHFEELLHDIWLWRRTTVLTELGLGDGEFSNCTVAVGKRKGVPEDGKEKSFAEPIKPWIVSNPGCGLTCGADLMESVVPVFACFEKSKGFREGHHSNCICSLSLQLCLQNHFRVILYRNSGTGSNC